MKVLVYTASSLCNPQFGIQMERAIEYYIAGNEVVFCHCAGIMSACSANFLQNKSLCHACRFGFRQGLKNLPKDIRIVKLQNNKNNSSEHEWESFNSIEEIKSYCYKDVEVGFSVLSLYISKTRNPNPLIGEEFLDCINKLLTEAKHLVDAAEQLIIKEKPDLIIYFNGRLFDTKPFFGLAKKYNIDYLTTENIGGIRADEEYRMVRFYNSVPFDAKIIYNNCLSSWDRSPKSEDEKITIGSSFYEKRRNGVRAGDYVYTDKQVVGKLPENYNPSKKNVVVYCSSEDEFSSVSSEVDKLFIFKSQYEAIKYLSENINDDTYHFIVRIHPNMKGLDVEYHNNLYKLKELKNVTVVAPEETVSSYALMDIAYNVVLFGSTVGAESLYWGKSVVLLGHADYYYWGVCSIPENPQQMIEMVKTPIVHPDAKMLAIKYGYYFLENGMADLPKYIHITPRSIKVLGGKKYVFDYLKFLRSCLLFKCISGLLNKVVSKVFKNEISFPERIRS